MRRRRNTRLGLDTRRHVRDLGYAIGLEIRRMREDAGAGDPQRPPVRSRRGLSAPPLLHQVWGLNRQGPPLDGGATPCFRPWKWADWRSAKPPVRPAGLVTVRRLRPVLGRERRAEGRCTGKPEAPEDDVADLT